MKATYFLTLTAIFLLLLFPSTSISLSQQDPSQVIRSATDNFMETMRELKQQHGDTPTDEMIAPLLSILEPVVDFRAIAKGIMGRHAKQASTEQLDRFNRVFKDWVVRYYLDSLLNFSIENTKVFDQPADFDPQSGSATVRMEATDSNSKNYEMRYSMRTNSSGEWKVRNFIFEGVNIGLTFLNQFDGAMKRYNNDIDKVIANWSDEMAQNGGLK